jgi:hypothetical protein
MSCFVEQHLQWAAVELVRSHRVPSDTGRGMNAWVGWALKPLRWLAERPQALWSRKAVQQSTVLLQVDGDGLRHVTHAGIRVQGSSELYPAEVLHLLRVLPPMLPNSQAPLSLRPGGM